MKEFTPIILVMIIGIVSILVFIKFEGSKPGDERPSPDEDSITFPVVNIESVSIYDVHTYQENPNNPELALKNLNRESTPTEIKLSDNSHGFILKDFWFDDVFPIVFTWRVVNIPNNVNKIKIKIGKYDTNYGYWRVYHTKVYDRTIENLDYFSVGTEHIYQYNLDGGRLQTTTGNYIITIDYIDFDGNEYSFPGDSSFTFRIEEEYLGLSPDVACARRVVVTPEPREQRAIGEEVTFMCGEKEIRTAPNHTFFEPHYLGPFENMTSDQCPEIIEEEEGRLSLRNAATSYTVEVSDCVTPIEVSQNNMCGPDYGTRCPGNQCCSQTGWCGGEKGKFSTYCRHADHGHWNGEYDGWG
jgi:hypothetical protein